MQNLTVNVKGIQPNRILKTIDQDRSHKKVQSGKQNGFSQEFKKKEDLKRCIQLYCLQQN